MNPFLDSDDEIEDLPPRRPLPRPPGAARAKISSLRGVGVLDVAKLKAIDDIDNAKKGRRGGGVWGTAAGGEVDVHVNKNANFNANGVPRPKLPQRPAVRSGAARAGERTAIRPPTRGASPAWEKSGAVEVYHAPELPVAPAKPAVFPSQVPERGAFAENPFDLLSSGASEPTLLSELSQPTRFAQSAPFLIETDVMSSHFSNCGGESFGIDAVNSADSSSDLAQSAELDTICITDDCVPIGDDTDGKVPKGTLRFKGALKAAKKRSVAASETARIRAQAAKERVAQAKLGEKAGRAWTSTKTGASAAATSARTKTTQLKHSATEEIQRRRSPESPSGPAADPALTEPVPDPRTTVFGVSLDEAVRKQCTIRKDVPDVVMLCVEAIRARTLHEEGIFRLSGGMKLIKQLRFEFDSGEQPDLMHAPDEHAVTGLLKLFLREIPGSIFTAEHHACFTKPSATVNAVEVALRRLPKTSFAVLEQIIRLLVEVIELADENKMTLGNLAIVFSATLSCDAHVLGLMIENVDTLFIDELDLLERDLIEF